MSQQTRHPGQNRIVSMKRYLERRQGHAPFETSLNAPMTTPRHRQHSGRASVHRLWPDPFLKPTACGHRPLARLTPQQKRVQKSVVKAIVYEFSAYTSPLASNTTSKTPNHTGSNPNAISKAWLTLADLVLNRINTFDTDPN